MPTTEFRATATASMLVIFESFAGVIFALMLYGAVVHHSGWDGVVMVGAMAIFIFAWWRSFLCEVQGGYLTYRSLLSRPPRILLSDIRSAKRTVAFPSRGNRPPNRLEIQATANGREVAFDINMKPFSRMAVRQIEEALGVQRT